MHLSDDAPLAQDFAHWLSWVLGGLIALVAKRRAVLGVHAAPLVERLARIMARVAALMARLGAGRPYRTRNPKPAERAPRMSHRLPQQFGWLLAALGDEALLHRARLENLLADPAIAHLFTLAPTALRAVRPLCRMLGLPDPAPGASSRRIPPPPRPKPEPPPQAENPAWDYRPSFHPLGPPPPYRNEPA